MLPLTENFPYPSHHHRLLFSHFKNWKLHSQYVNIFLVETTQLRQTLHRCNAPYIDIPK